MDFELLILLVMGHLQGDLAVQEFVFSQVDRAEPSGPQTVQDLVLAQHLVFGKHGLLH